MCVHLDYAIVPNILVIFHSIKILPRSSIQCVLQQLIMHTLFELWLQFCRIITKFWFSCVLITEIRIKFLIRLSLDCTFLTKKHEGRICQKNSFQNHSNKCENCELLVPHFRCYTKAQPKWAQSYYTTEDKASNLVKHLCYIPNIKYCAAHSDTIFYTSCMSMKQSSSPNLWGFACIPSIWNEN